MQLASRERSRPLRSASRAAAMAVGTGLILWSQVGPAAAALPSEGFADLAEKVTPAVVNISSTIHETASNDYAPGSMEDLMKRFQQQEQPESDQPMEALGSGFIISADGYVVTNNHVVDGADSVTVNLPNGDSYDATIVGVDPQTDLALLKIQADQPLPYVTFGDSDKLRVGDYVMAVGNPFGLGGSVTAGIVSARGRDIHSGPYDDFIQTDAAINRGNSGGPMFDMDGQVVGINSAIVSPNGGSVGIGFAIPSNLAKTVIADLETSGSVERGWLGVKIQPVTDEVKEALDLPAAKGALVAEVIPGSPAETAKLHQGDVILSYDGKAIGELRDLTRAVATTKVGEEAMVVVWRNGAEKTIDVTIAKQDLAKLGLAEPAKPKAEPSKELGALLAPLDENLRQQFQLADNANGVAVVGVDAGGQAAAHGMAVGDVIEKINSQSVESPDDVIKALKDAGKSTVLVLVNRGGEEQFVAFKLNNA